MSNCIRYSMKITPELIPHKNFHTGSWLLSVNRPEWYYFKKGKNANTIDSKDFLKSVDRPLRKLVKWLHERGIKTTPSCSGHHIRERVLENIYSALEQDAEDIRNHGLLLKDIETGAILLYRDAKYTLPWESKEEFIAQVSTYQQKGVLGLHLGDQKKLQTELSKLQIPGAEIVKKGAFVFIFTSGENTAGDNRRVWRKVRNAVIKTIDHEGLTIDD
jgi:hypothetical protein